MPTFATPAKSFLAKGYVQNMAISRTVWVLSLVSLFTDMASEMLYPVMPVYLKSIGFSVVLIGILEGLAEATAGLSKGYFGRLSDSTGRRAVFVQVGYGLSAVSKPLMVLFVFPAWVFFARTIDRLGKGIRTGARDAILSGEATPANKGKIFGLHRSMDTFGAVAGPLLALIYLHFYPEEYQTLFLLAFLPGAVAVVSAFLLRDKKTEPAKTTKHVAFLSFLGFWKSSPAAYRQVVSGLLVFALFNSSDVFLLLKAKEAGMEDTAVIGVYIFYNLVYALFAFPLGILADKIGLKRMLLSGIMVFSIVYLGMGMNPGVYGIIALFFLYGIYAAATEGVSKAWISNITEKGDAATAIGTYAAFQSICALLASALAGVVWYRWGANVLFILSGAMAMLVALYFVFWVKSQGQ